MKSAFFLRQRLPFVNTNLKKNPDNYFEKMLRILDFTLDSQTAEI